MRLIFLNSNKGNWGDLQAQISDCITEALKSGKDFFIELGEIKDSKSYKQCAAIHKLCQLLAIRLAETNGLPYDLENAKDFVKWQFDYTTKASDEECLAACINERAKRKSMGLDMKKEEFRKLFETFKVGLKSKRSFADATKEEMAELIKKIHELADKMRWEEVRLNSADWQSLEDSYNLK